MKKQNFMTFHVDLSCHFMKTLKPCFCCFNQTALHKTQNKVPLFGVILFRIFPHSN